MTPFIHLFKTLSGHYFYDVNKNNTVKTSEELFNYLKDNNEEGLPIAVADEIKKLKEDGYLSDNRVKRIEHPKTPLISSYIERMVGKITLQVTQNCNLRCDYCAYTANDGGNRLHNSKRMTYETAVKSLDMLKERSIDRNEIVISFYGGEPLLEYELIKKIVEYSKMIFEGKKIIYSMTTNGTLLNVDIIDFLVRNEFILTMSLDGPQTINDANRKFHNSDKSVFNEVLFWINFILNEYPDFKHKIGVNMVIDPNNKLEQYNELFEEYPIFKEIRVSATLADDFHINAKKSKSLEFIQELSYIKFLVYLNVFEGLNLDSMHLYKILFREQIRKYTEQFHISDRLQDVFAPSGPCIPGDSKIFIDVNGEIFPCERVSETIKSNTIGHVKDGISLEKVINVVNITRENEVGCKNCFSFRGCTNCVKYFEGNDNKSILVDRCQTVRKNFHNELIAKTYMREIIQY